MAKRTKNPLNKRLPRELKGELDTNADDSDCKMETAVARKECCPGGRVFL